MVAKATEQSEKSLLYASQNLESLFGTMISCTKNLSMDHSVRAIVQQPKLTGLPERFQAAKTMENRFLALAPIFHDINYYITILPESGDLYTSYYRVPDFDRELLYQSYRSQLSSLSYSWVENDPVVLPQQKEHTAEDRLSLVSPLVEKPNGEISGICVVSIGLRDVLNMLSAQAELNSSYVMLLDQSGEPICTGAKQDLAQLEGMDQRELDLLYNSKNYLVNTVRMDLTGYTLMEVIPRDLLVSDVNQLKRTLYITLGVSALIILLIGAAASFYVTSPLRKLKSVMRQVEGGNFGLRVTVRSKDEIGSLCKTFNIMIDKINQLFEQLREQGVRKGELELEALQLQIRPHFLLNTLNSIQWVAVMSQAPNVSDMIGALSNLLKVCVNTSEKEISVKREIQSIKDYLLIQKVRYSSSFQVEYEIDEPVMSCMIAKMTLQPIVENCLTHGLDRANPDGQIVISGYQKDGFLLFFVKDNGRGMTAEELETLLRNLNCVEKTEKSIGLRNVHQRLKMIYGAEYGLDFASEYGRGTVVQIKLPAIEGNTNHDSNFGG